LQVLIVWWCHDLSMDEIHPMGGYNWKQLWIVFVHVISNWNGGTGLFVVVSTHGHHFQLQFIFNFSIVAKTIIVGRVIFMNYNCSWAQVVKWGFLLLFGLQKELYTKWEEEAKGFCSKFMCTRKVLTCWCSPPYDLLYVDKWSKYYNQYLIMLIPISGYQNWWECEKVLKEFIFKL
jgi:hypothetical protein